MEQKQLINKYPTLMDVAAAKPFFWQNPDYGPAAAALKNLPFHMADIDDAEARLARFAPFLMLAFPETREAQGYIESPLTEIAEMAAQLCANYNTDIKGRLLLKQDSDLPIAGSVKARGGIYEVLVHAEKLALENGLLQEGGDYTLLATQESRAFFQQYGIQVCSTGNLGLSIGIMSAKIGFRVTVHMSTDARQWKKDLLRSKGVHVIEYATDYSAAIIEGRRQSEADPMSYFVDDENSAALFLGYAVAAKRLKKQLTEMNIPVDAAHPLFVYIPCGVGGAPGGIAFGLKHTFGDAVHVFFVEPVQAPCMLLGMATGLGQSSCVQDIGLTGRTHADGLAVARPSGFVGGVMKHLLSGEMTMEDYQLYDHMRELLVCESLFIEPSACAAFVGPVALCGSEAGERYIVAQGLSGHMENATHIAWATGGSLVPEAVREEYVRTFLR